MKKIIIGNWKMNKSFVETKDFVNKFNETKINFKDDLIYGLAIPFIYVHFLNFNIKDKNFKIAAQDVSINDNGAFTGDISASMLKQYNVDYTIVGHSERRQNHNETNEEVNLKAKKLLTNNIIPIICVGETLDQYEKGISKDIVKQQIINSTKDLELNKIIIAYEPIWAIGTSKSATNDYAQNMCKFIKGITSENTYVLYGGSVNQNNIDSLLEQKDIDGALVGNASLNIDSFISLLEKK